MPADNNQPTAVEWRNANEYDRQQCQDLNYTVSIAGSSGTQTSGLQKQAEAPEKTKPRTKSSNKQRTRKSTRNKPTHRPAKRETLAIQWNMNGYYNNLPDLEALVRTHQPVILGLQEIHRVDTSTMNRTLRGDYCWYPLYHSNVYHSAAVGVLSSIPHRELDLDIDLPVVGVRVEHPITITVISGYLPNGHIPNLKSKLDRMMSNLSPPFLIMLDANGHSEVWGSSKNTPRGDTIVEFANQQNLTVLNDGAVTRTSGQRQTAIDVSLASSNITNRLRWNAEDDPLSSDHHPIIITLDQKPTEISRRPRFLYDQADWEGFQVATEKACREHPPASIEDLMDIILNAATDTIPRTSPNPGLRATYWWNDRTEKAISERRKALRKHKRLSPDDPDKQKATEEYRLKRNECRRIIREAKKESWKNFLEGINPQQTASDLWNRINSLNGKRRAKGMCLVLPSGPTRDPALISEALAEHFADMSALSQYEHSFITRHQANTNSIANISIPNDGNHPQINANFSIAELDFALRRCRGRSAGPDEIGYPLLRNLPLHTKVAFLDKINQVWTSRILPESWTHSFVVPIPKPGKPSRTPDSFRPISLNCCSCKVTERMVNRRLTRFLEDRKLLDCRQHAFRSGHGTNTYLATLGDRLYDAVSNNKHVDLACLDLAKAYNRAWTPLVIQQLINWGLGGHLVHFVRNLLNKRTFQVTLGNHLSAIHHEETGVPQGSVIAVTLFLISMNSLFTSIPRSTHVFVYADDIVLATIGNRRKQPLRSLQAAVTGVGSWAKKTGFKISAEKSVITHICRHNHAHSPSKTTLNGTIIPFSTTVRILGVLIDRKLSFTAHFNDVYEKCKTRLDLLRTIAKPHQYSNRELIVRVMKAILYSKIFYGIEIFCTELERFQSRLGPVFNSAIRTAGGLLPSTPAKAACVELGVLPVEFKCVEVICNRTIGIQAKQRGNHQLTLLTEANRALAAMTGRRLPPVARTHWNGARGWNQHTLHVDSTIKNTFRAGSNPAAVQAHVADLIRKKYSTHTLRFTDGSKSDGRVGLGVTRDSSGMSYRLPSQCSVFSAEAAAILLAVSTPARAPILVVSDSASVLSALGNPTTTHPWIQAIQKKAPLNTTFMWVPGHCGVSGNEEADGLADIGRTSAYHTRSIPADDIKQWIKSIVRSSWEAEWSNSRDLFIRKVKGTTVRWTDTKNSHDQRILSRLRTGHTHATHNFGRGSAFHRQCPACSVKLTVEHMLTTCVCFDGPRNIYQLLPASVTHWKMIQQLKRKSYVLLKTQAYIGTYNPHIPCGQPSHHKTPPFRHRPTRGS